MGVLEKLAEREAARRARRRRRPWVVRFVGRARRFVFGVLVACLLLYFLAEWLYWGLANTLWG